MKRNLFIVSLVITLCIFTSCAKADPANCKTSVSVLSNIIMSKDSSGSLVATINGKPVYSDKEVTSVVNTKIYFIDGSTCDIATGTIENKGSGYINIGTPSTKNSKDESAKKSFSGSNVSIINVCANLEIQPYNGDKIIVTKKGKKSETEKINVSSNGNSVIIEDKTARGNKSNINVGGVTISGMNNSSIVSSSSITVNNGNITINGNNNNGYCGTNVKIQVPKGTSIIISNVNGQTTVGDTEGSVKINTNTGGEINVGSVKSTSLSIQGSSDVKIKNVKDSLNVVVQGSGDVKVANGDVNSLSVNIQGSGDFHYGGKAVDANLNVMGSGDIDVSNVKNHPITNAMGSGEIKVRNW